MKKFLSFALMAAMMLTSALMLTACSSDDDDDNGSSIVGEWVSVYGSTSDMIMEVINFSSSGSFTDTYYEIYGSGLGSDDASISDIDKEVDTGTYTAKDGTLSVTMQGETVTFSYSISQSGKNLTIRSTSGGSQQTLTFERMTSDERSDIADIERAYQEYFR